MAQTKSSLSISTHKMDAVSSLKSEIKKDLEAIYLRKLIDLKNQLKKCKDMFAITLFPKNGIEAKNRSALNMLVSIINQISKEVR